MTNFLRILLGRRHSPFGEHEPPSLIAVRDRRTAESHDRLRSLTAAAPPEFLNRVALRSVTIASIVSVVFAVFGEVMPRLFKVSVLVFQIGSDHRAARLPRHGHGQPEGEKALRRSSAADEI
jgi:hypothetical protein